MKKIWSIVLALVLTLSLMPMGASTFTANAASLDNLTYTITDGEVTITDCNVYASGALDIPSTIEGYPVTSIGDRAFSGCTSLTSITIPDSVTSIGDSAFEDCNSLECVYITDVVAWCNIAFAFAFDSNPLCYADQLYINGELATDVVIPDGVTSIGDYAFENYTSLTSVTIPDSVTSIGNSAFYECTSLTSVTIGNSVTSIGGSAFDQCTSLTSVTIGNSVTSIGNSAFYYCTSLTSVTIPDSVTNIEYFAFECCTSLTSVTIPDSVTSIGDKAFDYCTSLSDVWYTGDKSDRSAMSIGPYNEYLTSANWHYNTCEAEHSYSGICDNTCNSCEWTRAVVADHTYAGDCDEACDVCGEPRDVSAEHTYGDGQDAACSVCGTVRMPTSISVTTKPDKLSYLVGESFNGAGMVITVYYDNGTSSMVTSGYTVSGLDYAAAGTKTVTVSYAGFTASFDVTVNEPVIDENAPAFVVNGPNRPVRAGDTFTVTVNTKNNPGIVSLMVGVGYNADILELVSIDEQDFAGTAFGPLTNNPIAVNWCDALNPNNETNGVVAVLTFKVKESATVGDTAITLSYDPNDVYDYDFNNVTFAKVNGAVSVVEYISGDVNGDGVVNNKDLGVLQRHINGWDVDINVSAGDVNGDGSVNNKDLGLLQRYINGWNVGIAPTSMAIKTLPDKTVYTMGDSHLDTTGLTLELTYSSGATETVTSGFTTHGFNSKYGGNQTITVVYQCNGSTFMCTFNIVVKKPDHGTPDIDVTFHTDMAQEVLALVNQARLEAGLSALTMDNGNLMNAAEIRAKEITVNFAHERPDHDRWDTVFDEEGAQYNARGENLADGPRTAEEVFKAWMDSPGHKANMMEYRFTHISIACLEYNGHFYWVQLFGANISRTGK